MPGLVIGLLSLLAQNSEQTRAVARDGDCEYETKPSYREKSSDCRQGEWWLSWLPKLCWVLHLSSYDSKRGRAKDGYGEHDSDEYLIIFDGGFYPSLVRMLQAWPHGIFAGQTLLGHGFWCVVSWHRI